MPMSADFPYIDVAVRYDHGGAPVTMFTCPQGAAARIPAIDGRKIVGQFVNFSTGYVVSVRGDKRLFTLLQADNTSGPVQAVSVSVDKDVLLPGKLIVKLLGELQRQLGETDRLSEPTVNHLIKALGFPLAPLRRACNMASPAGHAMCYRTYVSASELNRLLTFPRQKQYSEYADAVFVPATVVAADSSLPRIQGMPETVLAVICPQGVTASADEIAVADKLTLTYERKYFENSEVAFVPEEPNCYATVDGPALVVNDAKRAGIEFRTRARFTVRSARGGNVESYTVSVNGHAAVTDAGEIEMKASDFEPSGRASISVSSTNFLTAVSDVSPARLHTGGPLDFVLEPEESSVLLRLNFGGGRVIEQRIAVGKSTPEYCQLRSGNFHGFRAHKLAGNTYETYNIDMTAGIAGISAQVKDSPAPAKEEATKSADAHSERQTVSVQPQASPKPEPPVIEPIEEDEEIQAYDEKPRRSRTLTVAGAILAVAVAAALVWYLPKVVGGMQASDADSSLLMSERVDTIMPEPQSVPVSESETKSDSVSVPDAGPADGAQAVSADEAADVEYLNKSAVWKRSELRSEKYRKLYDAFAAGDIRAIAGNEYFATPGRAVNADAVKVVDAIWASLGTGTQKSNERELSRIEKSGKINLHNLYESLARFRDKEPNKEPRPGSK